MNLEYTMLQHKTQDMLREADQRRLAREAQAEDAFQSLSLNLEKIGQQISARYARKSQIPVVPAAAEVCCNPA